jgi:hypothetical protein
MIQTAFWIHVGLYTLLGLALSCLLALSSQQVRMMFSSFFTIFDRPVSIIHERTLYYVRTVGAWALKQLEEESDRKGSSPIYFIIGATLYTLLTALFLLCDFGMIVLTAQAMGMDNPTFQLPIDTSTLTAATLVTTSLFWGAILFDLLGVTHLAPWRNALTERYRRILMVISFFFVAMSVFVGGAMAWERGRILNQLIPEAEASQADFTSMEQGGLDMYDGDNSNIGQVYADPNLDLLPEDSLSGWVVLVAMTGISVLSMSSSALSIVGLGIMAKFVILLVISFVSFVLLLPVSFTTWLISAILNWIFNFVQAVIDFLIHIGGMILAPFGWTEHHPADTLETTASTDAPASEMVQEGGSKDTLDVAPLDTGFNPFPRR